MEEALATTFLTGLDIGWPRSFTSASGVLGSALRYRNVFAGVGTAASHASNSHQLRQLLGRGAHTGDDNAGSDAGTQCASRRVSSNTFLNWPPFRPDTRHNLEGLRLSSSTGLCLTTTNVSN